jgi:hypothetical protein
MFVICEINAECVVRKMPEICVEMEDKCETTVLEHANCGKMKKQS